MTVLPDQIQQAPADPVVNPASFPRTSTPDWIILSSISDLAFRLYAVIKAHQSKDEPKPFPGQDTMAKLFGYAKTDPISAALQELRDIGAITTELEKSPRGRKTVYTLHEVPHGVGERYEGPRKTGDIYKGDALEQLAAARARRKRGVVRNPSGARKPPQRGTPLVKGDVV